MTNFLTAVCRKPAFIIAMLEYDFFFWAKEGETSFIMDVQTFCIVEMGLSSPHDRLSLHLISQEAIMKKVEHYQFLFFEGNDCLNIDHKFPM